MKYSYIVSALGLASSVFAAPTEVRRSDWSACIPQADAESLVDKYISILTHSDITTANATAQAILADDYQEISDSILSLEGQPVSLDILCLVLHVLTCLSSVASPSKASKFTSTVS